VPEETVPRIHECLGMHRALGWVNPPETLKNRDVFKERTWMYSQRVSGGFTHPKGPIKNPPIDKTSAPNQKSI